MHFPIITYHEIFDDSQANMEKHAIHVNEFERQMRYLSENDFESLSLHEMNCSDYKPHERKRKSIVISFDDGNFSDFCHAFSILKKYNYIGVFFITVDWVGKPGYVSWNNLFEMKNAGMSIQSHSMTHRFLSDLKNSDLKKELRDSKLTRENHLNCSVDFISIPGGFGSKSVTEMVKLESYRGICTSVPGWNKIEASCFSVFDRYMITRKTSFDTFTKIVNGDVKLIQKLRFMYKSKAILRRFIGNKLYYRLWSIFCKEV